jgi:hypothetical protein
LTNYAEMKDAMRRDGQAEQSDHFFSQSPGGMRRHFRQPEATRGVPPRPGAETVAPAATPTPSTPVVEASKPAKPPIDFSESAVIPGREKPAQRLYSAPRALPVSADEQKPTAPLQMAALRPSLRSDFQDTFDQLRRIAQEEHANWLRRPAAPSELLARAAAFPPVTTSAAPAVIESTDRAATTPPSVRDSEGPDVQGTGGYTYKLLANGDIKIVKSPTSAGGQIISKNSPAYKSVMSDIEAVRKNPRLGRVPFAQVTPLPDEMTIETRKQ